MKVKAIKHIPYFAKVGETIDVDEQYGRTFIALGTAIAVEDAPIEEKKTSKRTSKKASNKNKNNEQE